jgi:hypothetical protein
VHRVLAPCFGIGGIDVDDDDNVIKLADHMPADMGYVEPSPFLMSRAPPAVTSADRLLVQRYVELLRSRSHSDTNTALKVWQALCAKYAGRRQPNMTLFDRYVAEKRGEAPCE